MPPTDDNLPEDSSAAPPLSNHEAVVLLEVLMTSDEEESDDNAINVLGLLIDHSDDLGRVDGIDHALTTGNRLLERELSPSNRAIVHYFLSNAWESKRKLSRSGQDLHDWDQPELAKQIVHLRHAIKLVGESQIDQVRICQMYTNLGNLLNHCGRTIDALAAWDHALKVDADFAMALGNRAHGLWHYAQLVHDTSHQVLHLREAHACFSRALSNKHRQGLHRGARKGFDEALKRLTEAVPAQLFDAPPHDHHFRKGMSQRELEYRRWCLRRRLFLNDLNDLGEDPLAAADVLALPGLTTPINAGQPSVIGFFNQLKQEYVSARYLFYEGTLAVKAHFSDHDVTLVNTLDYPAYGLAAEKTRIAFRVAYSILDKVAYFLNKYLALEIPEKRVSFRSLWYDRQDASRRLNTDIHRIYNTPLKGLFWLSKDLYEKESGFTEAIEPDAQEIAEIRNHLEHKYFKLHIFGLTEPLTAGDADPSGYEPLAYSLGRDEFEDRTLRLLKMVRAALIQLSQALYVEEHKRQVGEDGTRLTAPIYLSKYEDDWKF